MYKYATAIGVDIGRFSLKIAVVNLDGDILLTEERAGEGYAYF